MFRLVHIMSNCPKPDMFYSTVLLLCRQQVTKRIWPRNLKWPTLLGCKARWLTKHSTAPLLQVCKMLFHLKAFSVSLYKKNTESSFLHMFIPISYPHLSVTLTKYNVWQLLLNTKTVVKSLLDCYFMI